MEPDISPVQYLLLEADRLKDDMRLSSVSGVHTALWTLLRAAEAGGDGAATPKDPEVMEAVTEMLFPENDLELLKTSVKLLRVAMQPREAPPPAPAAASPPEKKKEPAAARRSMPSVSKAAPAPGQQLKVLTAEGRNRPHLLRMKRDSESQTIFSIRCEGMRRLAALMVSEETDDALMRDICCLVAEVVSGNESSEDAAIRSGVLNPKP
ncbi:hypothetical protein T484DRAFT_1800465 [Baffinella frigidus]|nr:hypothetical protein T484DRAFT_1800465 [Cryptophyta sp. CCMP2293]